MGYEINTTGWGLDSSQGQVSAVALIDSQFVGGLFSKMVLGACVQAVVGVEFNMVLAPDIKWVPKGQQYQFHGRHSVITSPSSKLYTVINYTCTSQGSHTQTVNGPTTWTNNGNFVLAVPTAGASVAIHAEAANGEIELIAGEGADVGSLKLASTTVALSSAGNVNVTGTQSVSVQSGPGAVNVTGEEVSLKCNAAGVTATAASVTISGNTVQIGVPGQPNASAQVATMPAVEAYAAPLGDTAAAVAQLRTKLADLQQKIGKSKMLSALLK